MLQGTFLLLHTGLNQMTNPDFYFEGLKLKLVPDILLTDVYFTDVYFTYVYFTNAAMNE